MKSDSQLQLDVLEELRWEPGIDHEKIGVSVDSVAQIEDKLLVY